MRRFTKKRPHPVKLKASFDLTHHGLTDADLETLAALCETKGFEHIVCPGGNPHRAESWRDLAQRCRDAMQGKAVA